MILNYKLTAEDYLQYQLFISSRTEIHNKRRFRSRIIFPILYSILGLILFLVKKDISVFIILLIISLIWYVFNPIYTRWKYKRHFQKHIDANYQKRINRDLETKFVKNTLWLTDNGSVSKIKKSEFKVLIDTQNHFFLKLDTGTAVIIPKRSVENNQEFISLVTKLGVDYKNELDWKWK